MNLSDHAKEDLHKISYTISVTVEMIITERQISCSENVVTDKQMSFYSTYFSFMITFKGSG